MLNWRVSHVRDGCTYDKVRKRRRHTRKKWRGHLLLACVVLLSLYFLPPWFTALIAFVVIAGIAVLWILG